MQKRLVVLASGEGELFETLVKSQSQTVPTYEVVGLICNKQKTGVLERSLNLNVPSFICENDNEIYEKLVELEPDNIFLLGFLKKISSQVIKKFEGKIFNIHPSLLPKFGGRGMYGIHVHRAVIESGDNQTGVTIHQVDLEFDKGPVIAQKSVEVLVGETAEDLQKRVKEIEKGFLIETLPQILNARS